MTQRSAPQLRSLPAEHTAPGDREPGPGAAGQLRQSGDHVADAIVARRYRESGALVVSYATGLLKGRYLAGGAARETMLGAWRLCGEFRRRVLGRLSSSHRGVMAEVYLDGCAARGAAARLGILEGTVFSRSYDALRVLRQELGVTLPAAAPAAA